MVLARPPDAVASHFSAAALYGLGSPPPSPHVTAGRGRSARSSLGVVHRSPILTIDRGVVGSVPVTGPARTLVDCARVVRGERTVRLVDDVFHAELTTVGEVERALVRADGRARAGCRALRSALDPWRSTIVPDSPAEARLLRQLDAWGFPPPERQVPVFRDGVLLAQIDVGWHERLIGIEYDSKRWHGPERWSHDEARHRALVELGWKIVHADKADLRPGDRSLRNELRRQWTARDTDLLRVGASRALGGPRMHTRGVEVSKGSGNPPVLVR